MTTVAVTDYASLSTAINDFEERAYDQGQLDRFIGLAEGVIRLELPPDFSNQTSTTLTFVSGSVAQPSGFIRPVALTHSTYGGMDQIDIGVVRERRISNSGVPSGYAIIGTTFELDTTFSGSMTLDYEGTLAGLSSGNTTNWLITKAPHIYLNACKAIATFYQKNMGDFAGIQQMVAAELDALSFQSVVGQMGRATVTIPGMTP
jgi:hypothetical protein